MLHLLGALLVLHLLLGVNESLLSFLKRHLNFGNVGVLGVMGVLGMLGCWEC